MTQTLELTPAELEMIAIKREQELLAAKHTANVKAIQLEKDIKAKQDYITATKAIDAAQVKAAKNYLIAFDHQYSLEIKTWKETVQVMGDYIDKANPGAHGYVKHIEWSEEFERQSASIVHKLGQHIKIEEQIVYSSKWSSRGISKGYKMYISGVGIEWKQQGQALSKVKSVMEKIKAANDNIDNARKREENKKNALQTTVDRFSDEYPEAEVTTDYGYETSYGKRYSGNGERYNSVRIKFVNGAQIAYKVYPDVSLSRLSFNLPGAKDEDTFRNNLRQMNFKND